MSSERDLSDPLAEAVEEFNRHEGRDDGAKVAACLADALTIVRQSTYDRVHRDVEREVGADSMLMPISETKTRRRTTLEIEVFQIAESAAAARELGYTSGPVEWYVEWLSALRIPPRELDRKFHQQCLQYLAMSADERRLAFSDALGRVLPESRQSPLVLFRLLPMAVRIATAAAFGDRTTASGLRREQIALLPVIADCQECHGELLESARQCPLCGNPLWKYGWLTEVG